MLTAMTSVGIEDGSERRLVEPYKVIRLNDYWSISDGMDTQDQHDEETLHNPIYDTTSAKSRLDAAEALSYFQFWDSIRFKSLPLRIEHLREKEIHP